LRDLDLSSTVGLTVKYPDIYYGQEQYKYAIVPNKLNVVGISGTLTDPGVESPYKGTGGIPIPSLFRKALSPFISETKKYSFPPISQRKVSS